MSRLCRQANLIAGAKPISRDRTRPTVRRHLAPKPLLYFLSVAVFVRLLYAPSFLLCLSRYSAERQFEDPRI